MYKPECVLENEMQKILLNFEIQINHLILARRPDLELILARRPDLAVNLARRPDLVVIKTKISCLVDFVVPANNIEWKSKKKKWKESWVFRTCKGTNKTEEHEGGSNTNCSWHTWNGSQRFAKETGRVENRRMNQDHSEYSIVQISQDTEKGPRNLRRLAVTQTNHDYNSRPSDSQQKKRTCHIVDFAIPADLRVKLKEREKKNKYLILLENQKSWIWR